MTLPGYRVAEGDYLTHVGHTGAAFEPVLENDRPMRDDDLCSFWSTSSVPVVRR